MTIETGIENPGVYIDTLNDTYPAAGDMLTEGDNHLRGLKNVIKNTFPNVAGEVTPTHTELNLLDGLTAGTVTASKPVLVDANKDISAFRHVGMAGNILDTNGNELAEFGTTASAENHVKLTNAAAGNSPSISSVGTDPTANLDIITKGVAAIVLKDGAGNNIATLHGVASAVNNFQIYPSTAGNDLSIVAFGSDPDIDIAITPKGSGAVVIPTANITTANITTLNLSIQSEGSQSINAATAWVPAKGIYNIVTTDAGGFSLRTEIYVSGVWRPSYSVGGAFYCDGTNMRIYNSSGGAITAYYQKLG